MVTMDLQAVYRWSHWLYCFSMMGTNVPDALVAMGCPPVDFIMSRCAPTSLPSVRYRWPSGLNLVGQGKVTGSGFEYLKKSTVGP